MPARVVVHLPILALLANLVVDVASLEHQRVRQRDAAEKLEALDRGVTEVLENSVGILRVVVVIADDVGDLAPEQRGLPIAAAFRSADAYIGVGALLGIEVRIADLTARLVEE